MKRTGNVGVTTKWTVDMAIESINAIKKDMIKSGNDISSIVYAIRDDLKERNACRDFGVAVGMSKASISKMVTAETYRAELGITSEVSYNTIYKVKDLLTIDDCTTLMTVELLNMLKSEHEIRSTICKSDHFTENTAEDTAEDTAEVTAEDTAEVTTEDTAEDTRSEIVAQIFDLLGQYDIDRDDMKLIKMLIKGLR